MIKQTIGYIMLSMPFIGIVVALGIANSWKVAIGIFAASAAFMGWIWLGVCLVSK